MCVYVCVCVIAGSRPAGGVAVPVAVAALATVLAAGALTGTDATDLTETKIDLIEIGIDLIGTGIDLTGGVMTMIHHVMRGDVKGTGTGIEGMITIDVITGITTETDDVTTETGTGALG